MSMSPEQINQLKKFLEISSDSLTKKDFESSFKILIDYVTRVGKDLATKIDSKTENAETQLQETNNLYKQTIQKIEADNESTLSNVKKWALESVGKLFAKSKINEKLDEIDSALNRANKLTLPDASTLAQEAARMAQDELLPLIPAKIALEEELPALGKPIRDALELLQDDERLDKSAIKGLQEELDRIIAMIGKNVNFGGGVGLPRTTRVYGEAYTATDGQTDFTTLYTPVNGTLQVHRGGARQNPSGNYTISGQTVSFTVPLQAGEEVLFDYER